MTDTERLEWLWEQTERGKVTIERTQLFSVSSQWVTNVYGIRALIDEAIREQEANEGFK